MKNVEVTSCSHSHGRPISRVTTSKITVVQKPNSKRPQQTMRTVSSGSSARHFKCRCRLSTSLSARVMTDPYRRRKGRTRPSFSVSTSALPQLVDGPDQVLDLGRMRPELLGELVEIGVGNLLE